jgi:CheY-like chemotaxis protein
MATLARRGRRIPGRKTHPGTVGSPCPAIRSGPARNGTKPAYRPSVLLAYSGRLMREHLAVFLESRGCAVIACGDGKKAITHLTLGRFDLVVTGIVMPDLDGLELVRALRDKRSNIPVIAIADGTDAIDQIYLRNAVLFGAFAAHTLGEAGGSFLDSLDWILQGRDDVKTHVLW